MIQRKQTLFLLELVFLSIALFFVPANIAIHANNTYPISLRPSIDNVVTTSWHTIAFVVNVLCLTLALISIFLFKKRQLQMRLCYLQVFLWLIVSALLGLCPLAEKTQEIVAVQNNYLGLAIGLCAVIAAFFAARFIKKDIELLKSSDRIR